MKFDRVFTGAFLVVLVVVSFSCKKKSDLVANPELPGIVNPSKQFTNSLNGVLKKMYMGKKPRTRHLNADGKPKYTNRLVKETSPYLLQHAHNPVNWFPWNEEAFSRAEKENKPVFVSIGYSTCHWCHVMEEESFEDEEIAAFLNRNYIAIKVDREERPDIDEVYMTTVQMMTGRRGWPMTVMMTPDKKPFFGGTYFPARDGDRGSHVGLLTLLRRLRSAFENDREALNRRALEIVDALQDRSGSQLSGTVPGADAEFKAAKSLYQSFDKTYGGFGTQPKFPRPSDLFFLMRFAKRTGDEKAKKMVVTTLDNMAYGGLYDHIGGGFHRYSTDRQWLVPHFEKMLYDNALLILGYLEGYQLTKKEEYAYIARETIYYLEREMRDSSGGFYSASDADSLTASGEKEEGWFYTWKPGEIKKVLGKKRAEWFQELFGVTKNGNFEGRNILHAAFSKSGVAKESNIFSKQFLNELQEAKSALYDARRKRPLPEVDTKILTDWNGLTISALARAAQVFGDKNYKNLAIDAARYITQADPKTGHLQHSFRNGKGKHQAFLDDYSFLIQGLLDLYEATFDIAWLKKALELQEELDDGFWDQEGGGYFLTAKWHESLIARTKPGYDGATPSGNSVAAKNLLRLSEFTSNHQYRNKAENVFGVFSSDLKKGSTGNVEMFCALDFLLDKPLEIIIVQSDKGDLDLYLHAMRKTYMPNRILAITKNKKDQQEQEKVIKLFLGKIPQNNQTTAYVCRDKVCELPTTDPKEFQRQINRNAAPLAYRL